MKIFARLRRKKETAKAELIAAMQEEAVRQMVEEMRKEYVQQDTYDDVEAILKTLIEEKPEDLGQAMDAAGRFRAAFKGSPENHLRQMLGWLEKSDWRYKIKFGRIDLRYLPLMMEQYENAIKRIHEAAMGEDAALVTAAYYNALKIADKIIATNGKHIDPFALKRMASVDHWPRWWVTEGHFSEGRFISTELLIRFRIPTAKEREGYENHKAFGLALISGRVDFSAAERPGYVRMSTKTTH
jgi:hypothetical protein